MDTSGGDVPNKFLSMSYDWFNDDKSVGIEMTATPKEQSDLTKKVISSVGDLQRPIDVDESKEFNENKKKEHLGVQENKGKEIKVYQDETNTEDNIPCCHEDNYLVKQIYLTQNNAIGLVTMSIIVISGSLFFGLCLDIKEDFQTSFLSFIIPTCLLLCLFTLNWVRRFPLINKVCVVSLIPHFKHARKSLEEHINRHPKAMKYFVAVLNGISFTVSFILTAIYFNLCNTNKSVVMTTMYSFFDFIGDVLGMVLGYCLLFALCFSCCVANVRKTIQFHCLFLPIIPSFVVAYKISQASDSTLRMFSLVFFAVLSVSFFVGFLVLVFLIFFTDKESPIEMKGILAVFPVIVTTLIIVMLTWIILFLPGNKDILPVVINETSDENGRVDGIKIGGFNKLVKYYGNASSYDFQSETIDLSSIVTLPNGYDSSCVEVKGKMFVPVSSGVMDVVFIIHPNAQTTEVVDGYDSLASVLVSHNIAVIITNMTMLNSKHFKHIKPVFGNMNQETSDVLARAVLLLHHMSFIEKVIPQIGRAHLLGHGIGANVIKLAAHLKEYSTLPEFPQVQLPKVKLTFHSLSFVGGTDAVHPIMLKMLRDINTLTISPLSSYTFYNSFKFQDYVEATQNTLQTTLRVFGGTQNRFNKYLPSVDDTSKVWELNTNSLLSEDEHLLILRNTFVSFVFSLIRDGYDNRLINFRNNGFGSQFLVNTYRRKCKNLVDFITTKDLLDYPFEYTTNALFNLDGVSDVSTFKCVQSNCQITFSFNTPIEDVTLLSLDLSADETMNVTCIINNEEVSNVKLDIVQSIKLLKFKQQILPLNQLLQTYQLKPLNTSFSSFTIQFNNTIYFDNFCFQ
ncbi:hypothetical protein EIN_372190 [Entamoeba invadens IP1]|uniref:Uncharacterized protein n=1 Tax=Entamoeba invadens IP1 TaxID=370355 RepID=A0A0A1UGL7_ENTIV|nr:hypothetical protein EIN_372190 [Entamoeba invadens IP1]ELP92797.1 hypothetical protein EIN_372190 [Entamoeba invadens IP1]|eukprot:XP_004259568.1 hypothetical protein EIN_372190 [Entamoeba invadens IP1]